MLEIKVEEREFYDDVKNEFVNVKPATLYLEHSLASVSKWEGKYHKSFFETASVKLEPIEMLDYIKMMTLNKVSDDVYLALSNDQLREIMNYIEDPMTATTFCEKGKKKSDMNAGRKKKEIITAEIVYYWMVETGIPFECQYWHVNKLMALIRVCSIKNADQTGGNKMNKRDAMAFNRSLMASRRSKLPKGGHL